MGTSEVELLPLPNLAERGYGGRVDCAVGNHVPTVLLPSRPHEQVRVQWLGGKVEVITMACASCSGVRAHLLVGGSVGVCVGPVLRVVNVIRIRRSPLVSEGVPNKLADGHVIVGLALRGKHKVDYPGRGTLPWWCDAPLIVVRWFSRLFCAPRTPPASATSPQSEPSSPCAICTNQQETA